MPAPGTQYRLRVVLQDVFNDVGWSETYFGDIPPGAPVGWQVTVFTGLNAWINSRLGVLKDTCQIDFVVISDDGFAGDSILFNFPPPTGKGTFASSFQEGPVDAALIRFDDATGKYHGRKFFHGFNGGDFTQRVYTPGAAMVAAMGTFRTQTIAANLKLKNIQKPVAVPPVIIYNSIADVKVVRYSSHRVGRPFDYLRGRRRIA